MDEAVALLNLAGVVAHEDADEALTLLDQAGSLFNQSKMDVGVALVEQERERTLAVTGNLLKALECFEAAHARLSLLNDQPLGYKLYRDRASIIKIWSA